QRRPHLQAGAPVDPRGRPVMPSAPELRAILPTVYTRLDAHDGIDAQDLERHHARQLLDRGLCSAVTDVPLLRDGRKHGEERVHPSPPPVASPALARPCLAWQPRQQRLEVRDRPALEVLAEEAQIAEVLRSEDAVVAPPPQPRQDRGEVELAHAK